MSWWGYAYNEDMTVMIIWRWTKLDTEFKLRLLITFLWFVSSYQLESICFYYKMSNKRKLSVNHTAGGEYERGDKTPRHDFEDEEDTTIRDDAYYQQLYVKPPNFKTLAQLDSDFASVVKGRRELDFNDPVAVMQLTKTLLKLDFGISIELPDDRLCPPVRTGLSSCTTSDATES